MKTLETLRIKMVGFSGRFLKSSLNSTVPFFNDFHDRWSLYCTWVSYRTPLCVCVSLQCWVLLLDVEKSSEMPVAWGSCWCVFPGIPSLVVLTRTAPSKSLIETSLPRLVLHFFVVHSPLFSSSCSFLQSVTGGHRQVTEPGTMLSTSGWDLRRSPTSPRWRDRLGAGGHWPWAVSVTYGWSGLWTQDPAAVSVFDEITHSVYSLLIKCQPCCQGADIS